MTTRAPVRLGVAVQAQPVSHFWGVWRLYNVGLRTHDFSGIHFRALVPQIPKLLALFFTVAFGSSMDVVSDFLFWSLCFAFASCI